MKKNLISLILLLLICFLPTKTSDMLINTNENNNVKERKENVIKEPIDTTPIEKVEEKTITKNWWEYPDEIFPTKRNGDDLLVLVNKQYKLQSTYAPQDLVKASSSGIRRGDNYYLRNILIEDLKSMVNDARNDNIDLSIVSGYRSYQTQVDTYNYWLNKNNNNVAYVDTFSARPGHSQHQLGTAIDFSSNEINDVLGDSFTNTNASK